MVLEGESYGEGGNHYFQDIANCMIFVKLYIYVPEFVIFCQILAGVESLTLVLEYIEHKQS